MALPWTAAVEAVRHSRLPWPLPEHWTPRCQREAARSVTPERLQPAPVTPVVGMPTHLSPTSPAVQPSPTVSAMSDRPVEGQVEQLVPLPASVASFIRAGGRQCALSRTKASGQGFRCHRGHASCKGLIPRNDYIMWPQLLL